MKTIIEDIAKQQFAKNVCVVYIHLIRIHQIDVTIWYSNKYSTAQNKVLRRYLFGKWIRICLTGFYKE